MGFEKGPLALEEEKVIEFWREIDAFQTSYKLSLQEDRPPFVFYDGPPFATGLPHYGHILASTIKDTVTRFAHATGYSVNRQFGWDTHGLPVEHEIDKKLGITGKDDVMKMGIDKYNAECRAIVMRYAGEWRKTIERIGRWIDFDKDYKTLYPTFMESVWWVFKELWDKGYVYRGFKVMPYSTGCTTPLSNFEAQQNFQDVNDPSVYVAFPLIKEPETSLLIWTTTPWTLPSNLGICAHPDFIYVKIYDLDRKHNFILLESRLSVLFKDPAKALNNHYKIIEKLKGSDLEGLEYEPLYDYFVPEFKGIAWKVLTDTYVTDTDGTGLVHQAPAFGEDDYRIAQVAGIINKQRLAPCPIDEAGRYVEPVRDYLGQYVKEADKQIQKDLKQRDRLIVQSTIKHAYPYCWRSDTPLLYRTVPAWFVSVSDHTDLLLECNRKTRWVPDFVGTNRFANWVENAKDWNISRNRYWGTPLPLWTNEDFTEVLCIGSIAELEKLSGCQKLTDLHRDSIDHITIPSRRDPGKSLKRIEEVFDCWFESGSMPYASKHYPFENKEKFDTEFPAQFIAEGLDQTRGWFYTLLILGALLRGTSPFQNVIVNGIVLAEDGKKMSKRLKNYPDPGTILDKYGADALRVYLINSPVVRAETLRFKEDGVKEVVSKVLLPWLNSFRFFSDQATLFKKLHEEDFVYEPDHQKSKNPLDNWILAEVQSLIKFIVEEMRAYRLYNFVGKLLDCLDDLTNCYIRFNRKRLKGENGRADTFIALNTLFEVLYTLVRTMSSFAPFLSETIYLQLRPYLPKSISEGQDTRSVHFLKFPEVRQEFFDELIQRQIGRMRKVIDLGRQIRERMEIKNKIPLSQLIVVHRDEGFLKDINFLQKIIMEELNVRKLTLTTDEDGHGVTYKVKADFKVLGKKLGKQMKSVSTALADVTNDEVRKFMNEGTIMVNGAELMTEDLAILKSCTNDRYEVGNDPEVIVLLDVAVDEESAKEALVREVINRVQKLRKKSGLQTTDDVRMEYKVNNDERGMYLTNAIASHSDLVIRTLRGALQPHTAIHGKENESLNVLAEEEQIVDDITFMLRLLEV